MIKLDKIGVGQGMRHMIAGAHWTWKAESRETGGSFCFFEQALDPGDGVPPHTHSYAEAFYILEGEVEFGSDAAEDKISCRAGDTVLARPGARHSFRNSGMMPARLLSISSGAHQRFFDAIVAADQDRPFATMSAADVMARVIGIGAATDTHFIGPASKSA